jgi:hypothetical protein
MSQLYDHALARGGMQQLTPGCVGWHGGDAGCLSELDAADTLDREFEMAACSLVRADGKYQRAAAGDSCGGGE